VRGTSQLAAYLRDGQRTGELSTFSIQVMAVTIRAAIDGVAATGVSAAIPQPQLRVPAALQLELAWHALEPLSITDSSVAWNAH
jgi:hypothetical protein